MARVTFGSPGLGSASIDFDDDQLLVEFMTKLDAGFQSDRRGCWVDWGQVSGEEGNEPPGYVVQWVPASTPVRFLFGDKPDAAVEVI
jgi:hypothetical protein